MSKKTHLPKVKIAPRVTRKDGETFAQTFLDRAYHTGAGFDAFSAADVVKWPGGGMEDPRQDRYNDIENEVLDLTFAAIQPAIAEAFVKVARKVLARERRRG